MIFLGCASKTPMTTGIIYDVGVENATAFQYYVSKPITLTLVTEERTSEVRKGRLHSRSRVAKNKIVIKEKLPGIALRHENWIDGRIGLAVAFEKKDGEPTLYFSPNPNFPNDQRQFLNYADPENLIVVYGADRYRVSFDSKKRSEQPYLLIKSKQRSKQTAQARNAKGMRL